MAVAYRNVHNLLREREVQPLCDETSSLERALVCNSATMNRLALHKSLEGHSGCVNCLEWSRDGKFLASGSDDFKAYLWDAERYCATTNFHTGHGGNIFSVKFVQQMNNRHLLTCADDRQVRHHDIVAKETITVWHCSAARVKRLATVSNEPHLFWSAAEDGYVRQYDLREPHHCSSGGDCGNIVVDLHHISKEPQCKCVEVNQVRTELLAVGSIDPFVRLFDRRIFSPGGMSSRDNMSTQPSCLAYYAPGHLSDMKRLGRSHRSSYTLAVTYVTFSPDGSELLVNMSDEYVYLYNLLDEDNPVRFLCPTENGVVAQPTRLHPLPTFPRKHRILHGKVAQNPCGVNSTEDCSLSRLVCELEREGRVLHQDKCYFEAIQNFNEAIDTGMAMPSVYLHRALSYLGRKWEGDVYSALRDIETALELDPASQSARSQRILALSELGWREEALAFFEHYKRNSQKSDIESLKDKMDKLLHRASSGNGRHHTRSLPNTSLTSWENRMQASSRDYQNRYCGHWNTNTDIKEANFLGPNGEFVAAGSDDGNIFIWEKSSGKLFRVLVGDSQIVNCIQWHPSRPLLATSGIEHVVRIWEPKGERDQDGVIDSEKFGDVCKSNQRLMRIDPYAYMLMHMGFTIPPFGEENHDSDDEEAGGRSGGAHVHQLQCRQS